MIIIKTRVLGYRNIKTHEWQKYSFQMGKLKSTKNSYQNRSEIYVKPV